MKNSIPPKHLSRVEQRLKAFESLTGCDLLLIVVDASDPYPAAPWRFGVISGFLCSLIFGHYFTFHSHYLWPVSFLLITLFMTWVGHFDFFKRLALSTWETQRECQEKALELFHTWGTSKVGHKVTAMIMISLLEKRVEVLVDEKLKSKIEQEELNALIEAMKPHFKQGHMADGLIQSIEILEAKIVKDFGGRVCDISPSELKDTVLFLGL